MKQALINRLQIQEHDYLCQVSWVTFEKNLINIYT